MSKISGLWLLSLEEECRLVIIRFLRWILLSSLIKININFDPQFDGLLKIFPEILWRLHLLWSHHDLTPVLPCCQRMWGCICWISKDRHSLIIWSLIVSDSARHLWYVHLACFVGIVFGVTVLLLSRGHYSIGDDPDNMQLCQKSMTSSHNAWSSFMYYDDYLSQFCLSWWPSFRRAFGLLGDQQGMVDLSHSC